MYNSKLNQKKGFTHWSSSDSWKALWTLKDKTNVFYPNFIISIRNTWNSLYLLVHLHFLENLVALATLNFHQYQENPVKNKFSSIWTTSNCNSMSWAPLTRSPFSPFDPTEGSKGTLGPGGPGRPSGPLRPSLPGNPSRPYIIKHTLMQLSSCSTSLFNH